MTKKRRKDLKVLTYKLEKRRKDKKEKESGRKSEPESIAASGSVIRDKKIFGIRRGGYKSLERLIKFTKWNP